MGNLKEFVKNCVENYRSAGESSTKGQTEVILEKFAQHLDEEGVSGGGGGADWAQNDPNGDGYVKNRPFYTTDPVETVLYENASLELTDLSSNFGRPIGLAEFAASLNGYAFTCVINGVSYEAERKNYNGYDYLGNLSLHPSLSGEDTGEPYLMLISSEGVSFLTNIATSGTISLAIKAYVTENIKVPDKYLPDRCVILPPIENLTEESASLYMEEYKKGTTLYFKPDDSALELVVSYRYTKTLGFSFVSMGLYKIRSYMGGIGQNYDSSQVQLYNYDDITKCVSFSSQSVSTDERKQALKNLGITGIIARSSAPPVSDDSCDLYVDNSSNFPALKYAYRSASGVTWKKVNQYFDTAEPLLIRAFGSDKIYEIRVHEDGTIKAVECTNL